MNPIFREFVDVEGCGMVPAGPKIKNNGAETVSTRPQNFI